MGLIKDLPDILRECRIEYENWKAEPFQTIEEIEAAEKEGWWKNLLALGDNCSFMKFLLQYKNMAGKLQMIYIDPPFFSKANYDAVIRLDGETKRDASAVRRFAYEDIWRQGPGQYLKMLGIRLFFMRDLLSEEGTVWVHLDWHADHYVRLFLDEIFGADRFVNEIIWTYKSGGTSKRHFARKHDTILVYSKTKNYYFNPLKEKSYNRGLKPYHFKGVEEFQDQLGWYTMVNMKDVWQIDMVGRTSAERTGYATQKPEALLERIISCSSREGDICADFFCGSGTMGTAAQKLGRRWICCDSGSLALSYTVKRLLSLETRPAIEILAAKERTAEIAEKTEQIEGAEQARARLFVDVKKVKNPAGHSYLLVLNLTGYQPEIEKEDLDEKGRKLYQQLAAESPLRLLDCWSIDFSYDGKVFRPEIFFLQKKNGLPLSYQRMEKEGAANSGKICVKAADVFGNCTYRVIDREML